MVLNFSTTCTNADDSTPQCLKDNLSGISSWKWGWRHLYLTPMEGEAESDSSSILIQVRLNPKQHCSLFSKHFSFELWLSKGCELHTVKLVWRTNRLVHRWPAPPVRHLCVHHGTGPWHCERCTVIQYMYVLLGTHVCTTVLHPTVVLQYYEISFRA